MITSSPEAKLSCDAMLTLLHDWISSLGTVPNNPFLPLGGFLSFLGELTYVYL